MPNITMPNSNLTTDEMADYIMKRLGYREMAPLLNRSHAREIARIYARLRAVEMSPPPACYMHNGAPAAYMHNG